MCVSVCVCLSVCVCAGVCVCGSVCLSVCLSVCALARLHCACVDLCIRAAERHRRGERESVCVWEELLPRCRVSEYMIRTAQKVYQRKRLGIDFDPVELLAPFTVTGTFCPGSSSRSFEDGTRVYCSGWFGRAQALHLGPGTEAEGK